MHSSRSTQKQMSRLQPTDDTGTNNSHRPSTANQTNHSCHLIQTALLKANFRKSSITSDLITTPSWLQLHPAVVPAPSNNHHPQFLPFQATSTCWPAPPSNRHLHHPSLWATTAQTNTTHWGHIDTYTVNQWSNKPGFWSSSLGNQ